MAETSTPSDISVRNWAMLCHLSALLIFYGVPFGNILGPLIVYLIKKDDDPFIATAGLESLNFQIFVSICGFILIIAYLTSFLLAFLSIFGAAPKPHPPIFALELLPLFLVLFMFDFVSVIVAAVRTNLGVPYRYPITLRFVH